MSRFLLLSLILASVQALAAVDPTQPPVDLRQAQGETAVARPVLQAILRSDHGSHAVIAGHSLRVGQQYGGLRVVAIYPTSVLIERQGQRELLRLAVPVMKPSR